MTYRRWYYIATFSSQNDLQKCAAHSGGSSSASSAWVWYEIWVRSHCSRDASFLRSADTSVRVILKLDYKTAFNMFYRSKVLQYSLEYLSTKLVTSSSVIDDFHTFTLENMFVLGAWCPTMRSYWAGIVQLGHFGDHKKVALAFETNVSGRHYHWRVPRGRTSRLSSSYGGVGKIGT